MTAKEGLAAAVQQFREWADANAPPPRGGEWETEYLDWEGLYGAANAVLATESADWDEETMKLLLYTIARDNEDELLAGRLIERQLIVLARRSLNSDEPDAKWQLAVQMLRFPLAPEREDLLVSYAEDADEYVRRRALMVLAELGSTHTERLAFAAWETGHEYQRMVCLHALFRVNSPSLGEYLRLAKQDGREYLSRRASEIANRIGEYAQ